jgi:hypothetical protein
LRPAGQIFPGDFETQKHIERHMKNPILHSKSHIPNILNNALAAILTLLGMLMVTVDTSAQTTNAYDTAANSAYAGDGPGDGLGDAGNPNGGFGFGPWTFTVLNNGGAFINGSGPSGDSFDLWNVSASSSTVAVRPFGSPLVPGQSFSVQLRLNSLDNSGTTNALMLQDAGGNTIFSYWHVGYEANANNGEYSDATTNHGTAVNFQYAYQQFESFTFSLNSPTTYTFTDISTGASFTGTISGSQIAQVAFYRGNSSSGTSSGGNDFQFDVLQILSATPPTFAVTPVPGVLSVPVTNSIVAQVAAGSTPLNLSPVALILDGSSVTPTVGGSSSLLTVNYTPNPPLSAGSTHTVQLVVQNNNAVFYTNIWSFTTGFSSLPAVLPGPFTVSNAVDLTIFTAAGDPWLGSNYLSTSSQTLYAQFSMAFDTTNDTSSIYTFGGMDFYQGGNEKLLFGKNGGSANWSIAIDSANGPDLNPVVAVFPNDWHTIVVRIDYQDGAPANETVWLDPDFTQMEANQPQSPVTLSDDNTFDNIHIRCGFNDAGATYTNIIMSATTPFLPPASPTFEDFIPGENASNTPPSTVISVEALFGSYSISTNSVTLNLDGNNVTPTFEVTTNSITVTYQPPAPFAAGSTHTATVSLTDANGSPYSTGWSFTVDPYPSLPVVAPGPFLAVTGDDVILWTSQNGWTGTNYGPNSTNTLYGSFSMTFYSLNGETGSGGGFGGLEFYLGNDEQFLIANNWLSTNWSVSVDTASTADIPPVTPIVLGTWHTLAVKSVYYPNTNALVYVWLDPDYTKTEGNQPNLPLSLSINNTFDNIHLRAGNGSAEAEYTNIVFAATAQGIGFAPPVALGTLSIQNVSGSIQLSWTSIGTLQAALLVTGPWSDFPNQSNPQVLSTTNAAQFFRLRQ